MLKRLFTRQPSQLDLLRQEIETLKAKASQYPAWALEMAGVNEMALPDPSVYAAQASQYQSLSWINIAVNFKAGAAAAQKLSVVRTMGEDDEEAISNHPFELLLYSPNPLMSRFELLFSTFAFYALCGNAYWWLNKATDAAEPAEIWMIPPQRLQPIPDGKLYLQGYYYFPGDGNRLFLNPWEIVHFHGFNPMDEWLGMSNFEPVAVVAEGDKAAARWNTKFFRDGNGKLPSVLAFADNIPDPDWNRIKDDVRDKSNQRQMMMLRNVKAGGINWIQATATQREMEFLAGRKANRDEIWNTFAPGLVSILSENATEANAKSGKATFAEYALWPALSLVAEKITADVLPCYGDNLKAEFADPRISDRAMELLEINEYSKTHTIDEVRQKYYSDAPLAEISEVASDTRGNALPSQIGPSTPIPSDEPEVAPEPVPTALQPFAPSETPSTPDQAVDEVATPPAMPEDVASELAKWRRKALNAVSGGKSANVKFESDVLPANIYQVLSTGLANATDAGAVRTLFENVTVVPAKSSDAAAVLEAIRLGVEALKVIA
jgi:phage portal protein BeeE